MNQSQSRPTPPRTDLDFPVGQRKLPVGQQTPDDARFVPDQLFVSAERFITVP